MQTECPHCHTVFRVSEAQLDKADGQVRCGHCLAIFTADTSTQDHHQLEITTAKDEEETVALESLVATDETSEVLPDVIPPELRAETRSKHHNYSIVSSIFWAFAILLMIIVGLLQYAYYDRHRLVQFDDARPWLSLLCEYAQCELPEPRDPSRIELSSKNIFTHPNNDNALMVSATIVNQAEYEQAFPLIELRFENIRGQLIAGRQFSPSEYLGVAENSISKMEPGNPVSFNIEIIDPGKDVMSYEFKFL